VAWPRWLGGRGRPRGGGTATAAGTAAPLLDEGLLRRLERMTLMPRKPVAGGLGGEHRSSARASSMDFADYRQYVGGDDFRRIDWNAYGRTGNLYVKLTEAREQLPLHILVDASSSMAWGEPQKLRYASQLAAALGYVGLARFDRLTVTALGAYLVDRRAGGLAILISDLLSPDGYEDGLDALLQAGLDVIVLQILSPQELEPAEGGDVELVDAETGEIVEVSLTPRMIGIYRERLDRWCAEAAEACGRRGVTYCRLTTDIPIETVLLDQLRRVGVLR
jgi:hypothetical protein